MLSHFKKQNKRPNNRTYVQIVAFPRNHKKFYMFGESCYLFNRHKRTFEDLPNIPRNDMQSKIHAAGCATFKIKKK